MCIYEKRENPTVHDGYHAQTFKIPNTGTRSILGVGKSGEKIQNLVLILLCGPDWRARVIPAKGVG